MNPNKPIAYQFIDTNAALNKMVRSLAGENVVAFDLEADSMYHFTEKICLLQIATKHNIYLVDPLMINDISALKPVFANGEIQKLFHGADYDVRSLYRDYGIKIDNLFDTQVACRFLGMNETGLDTVVFKQFNILLDKKYQKKDWSLRPLSKDMLAYAARDVIYLIPLFKVVEKELKKRERLSWVQEECERLSRVRPAPPNRDALFLKFKGAGRLNPRDLTILEAILKLRKKFAEKKDRPPFKIFGNSQIMKMVQLKPVDINRLKKTNAFSPRQTELYARALINTIKSALKKSEADLCSYPRKRSPMIAHAVRKRIKTLKDWRDRKARKLELDPGLVCSKNVIIEIATINPANIKQLSKVKELKNWQKTLLGKEIIAKLEDADERKN